MILPMKKYSMLIHHTELQDFLKDLQNLGVLDVVDRGVTPNEETNAEIQRVQLLNRVIKFLKLKEQKDTPETSNLTSDEILDSVLQFQSDLEEHKQKIAQLEKHFKAIRPWGNFELELFSKLKDKGLYLRFFAVSQRKFKNEWLSEYNLEIINQTEGQTFFVIVQREGEQIDIDAEEVRAPERSAPKVQKEIEKLKADIEEIHQFFDKNAKSFLPKLIQSRTLIENRISFDVTTLSAASEAEDRLKIIEGWIPESAMAELDTFLDEKNIYHLVSDPDKKEKVPILLKNGKFSKLFEPIGNLYSLPSYGEFDLTPFFAPFFMMFFGFCLGDAGYGLLFLIVATIYKPKAKPDMKKILALMQWLGGSTIIFGMISGTIFGINLINVADSGKFAWLTSVREYMLDSEKMFYFALILGAIQIIFGMGIKAGNHMRFQGFKYALSTLGWMLLILGGIALYIFSNERNQEIITILTYVLLGVSGIFILFMNNPDKNIFVNFGGGLWEVYSIVTGVMGDLLSYIRLFALGVSSAILGFVFNDLAMQMSGNIPVVSQIIFLLIIVVGHGLNIFMASLGAFVHPLRLTFVEFYKNAGFQGGGKAYNPFRTKQVD